MTSDNLNSVSHKNATKMSANNVSTQLVTSPRVLQDGGAQGLAEKRRINPQTNVTLI